MTFDIKGWDLLGAEIPIVIDFNWVLIMNFSLDGKKFGSDLDIVSEKDNWLTGPWLM